MERWRVSSRGDTTIFKPYLYVPFQRVGFLRRFRLKTGIDFTHFGLHGIGNGFRGNYRSV